jgi:hypothetical protein
MGISGLSAELEKRILAAFVAHLPALHYILAQGSIHTSRFIIIHGELPSLYHEEVIVKGEEPGAPRIPVQTCERLQGVRVETDRGRLSSARDTTGTSTGRRSQTYEVAISLHIRMRPVKGRHRHHQQDHTGSQARRGTCPGPHHRGSCPSGLLQICPGRDGVGGRTEQRLQRIVLSDCWGRMLVEVTLRQQ